MNHPMFELVDFIFDPNIGAKTFQELQEWIEANIKIEKQEEGNNFFSKIFEGKKTTNS